MGINCKKALILSVLAVVLLALSFTQACGQAPSGDLESFSADPDKVIDEIYQANKNIQNLQADVLTIRKHAFFMRGILPPYENINFTRPVGVINFSVSPRIFNLNLFPKGQTGYYYDFFSYDGYGFKLMPDYMGMIKSSSELKKEREKKRKLVGRASKTKSLPPPKPSERELETRGNINRYSKALRIDSDKNVVFDIDNPLNLAFPFYSKIRDANWKTRFLGRFMMDGIQILVIEIKSKEYGHFKLYVTNDEYRYVKRIDLLDPLGRVYAKGTYWDFENLKTGGWIHKGFQIEIDRQPVIKGSLYNIVTNIPLDDITGFKGDQYKPGKKPEETIKTASDPARAKLTLMLGFLYLFILIFGARMILFQRIRPVFSQQVLMVDGRRSDDKVGEVLKQIGIETVPLTQEDLNEEIEILRKGSKTSPRLIVVAPGMAIKSRNFNFLIKSYVEEGGRVILFEHTEESGQSLPFTPVYIKYDPGRHSMEFKMPKKWEHIFKKFPAAKFKGRLSDFNLRSLLVKARESKMTIDPIVLLDDEEFNLKATPLCVLKDGKGEYLIVQYRLFSYIANSKNPAEAREMLKDLFLYMFGGERLVEIAPDWLKFLLWIPVSDNQEKT